MTNGHLVWIFILRALHCQSKLNLLSNHISSINYIPIPLKTCNCLLTGLKSIMYQYICNIFNLMIYFFLLPPVAKQLEILSYQQRSVA